VLSLLLTLNAHAQGNETQTVGMSAEKKSQHIESFRKNFLLINEMKINNKDDMSIITRLSENAIEKDKNINRSLSLNERKSERSALSYSDGFRRAIAEDKYRLGLSYSNDSNYPIMYAPAVGNGTFSTNKSPELFESKSKEILINFLGEEYKELEAKLVAVNQNRVTISIMVDDPNQFERLVLEDIKLLNLTHIDNPPPSDRLYLVQ